MEQLLLRYVEDPLNPELNFNLALYYENKKHYAGACAYYLRTAEWENSPSSILTYEALLHLSICFRELGNRQFSEEGWLLHAISLRPDRPEAYWLLSQLYERQSRNGAMKWQESYMMASIGLHIGDNIKPLEGIGYEGVYCCLFQKMVAAWYIPKQKECRNMLFELPSYPLSDIYINLVQNNMNIVGSGADINAPMYSKDIMNKIRIPFAGLENIDHNHSQAFQDMFVLSATNGKRNGFYIEIGAGDPIVGSNTFLLEKQFEWSGISIEIRQDLHERFKKIRNNVSLLGDATSINYKKLFARLNTPYTIDYLQIDCEPAETSYKVLTLLPFDQYRFSIITFEHDYALDAKRIYKDLSRNLLKGMGYKLLVDSICIAHPWEFEDWWIHPDLIVDQEIVDKLLANDGKVKSAHEYLFPTPIIELKKRNNGTNK